MKKFHSIVLFALFLPLTTTVQPKRTVRGKKTRIQPAPLSAHLHRKDTISEALAKIGLLRRDLNFRKKFIRACGQVTRAIKGTGPQKRPFNAFRVISNKNPAFLHKRIKAACLKFAARVSNRLEAHKTRMAKFNQTRLLASIGAARQLYDALLDRNLNKGAKKKIESYKTKLKIIKVLFVKK